MSEEGIVDGWHHKDRCQPPGKYRVHWKKPNPKSKTGYSNMTTIVVPEVLVQIDGSYDPNTNTALYIIAEWLPNERRWQWDGSKEFKQSELNWWRNLPQPRRGE